MKRLQKTEKTVIFFCIIALIFSFFLAREIYSAWQDRSVLTTPASDDELMIDDVSDPTDHATYGTVKRIDLADLIPALLQYIADGDDMRIATTTSGHSWAIQIYDNDNTTWRDCLSFTNGNTPTVSLGSNCEFGGLGSIDLSAVTDYKVGGSQLGQVTETLQNKTISASNNTLSNIGPGEVDAELSTDSETAYIEDPTTETFDEIVFFAKAVTITRVTCITDTGTADINFENGANNVLSAELVCDSDEQDSCASGCDVNTIQGAYDNFSQYSWGDIDISATSGSPTKISIAITFTVDD